VADFQRAMMIDIDLAVRRLGNAEIEDFIEGFNQPTRAVCGLPATGSLPGHPRTGGLAIRGRMRSGYNDLAVACQRPTFDNRVNQRSTSGPMESAIEEIEKFAAKVDRAAERVFASASRWNREPAKAGDPKIIAVLLLIRTLSNFRGTVILLRADRIVEARTIARCCSENLFHIAALRNDGEQFVREMDEDHGASQKARGEFLIQQTGELPEAEWQQKLRAFLASLGKVKVNESHWTRSGLLPVGHCVRGTSTIPNYRPTRHTPR
jgi:hypothetical protein